MAYEAKLVEILILLRLLSVSFGEPNSFTLIGSCSSPLGMEGGRIPDSAITASSSYESKSVGPQNARVRQEKSGGAWCPKVQISSKVREYLEIDLDEPHLITYTETQGRFGNGQGAEYAEHFAIEYWRAPLKNWIVYKDHRGNRLLSGNSNTYTEVKQRLELPFVASKIRFVPFSEHPRTVCMRVEVYGCPWKQNLVAYTAPRADTEFEDVSYDGIINDRSMANGLGQLVDGVLGDEDFLNHNQQWTNKKWVGWMDDRNLTEPLEILFEFVDYNQISALFLHTSHFETREVQIFSKAEVLTSVNGVRYYSTPVKIKPSLNRLHDGTHNVTIHLDVKIAKFFKLRLHYSARWILISEVQFNSRPVDSNKTEELLLKYGSLMDSGVQPHQSADDKDHNRKGLKINLIDTNVYVMILTIFAVLALISGVVVIMGYVVKKNRQTKLMRKHSVLPVSSTFPRVPIAMKELEIATPIIDHLKATRARQSQTHNGNGGSGRDQHAKSTSNIYSDISGAKNGESEESDTSSLYHEPYRRIGVPLYSTHTNRVESRKNTEYSSTTNFHDDRKYSSISLYNLPTQFPPIATRTQTSYTSVHSPPVTFSNPSMVTENPENYYAAADVVQEESGEQHFALGKFTPLKLPAESKDDLCECGPESKSLLLEFSRHRLRVIEKLGEGSFGMIHLCETEFTCDTYGHTVYHKKQVIVKSMRRGISEETRIQFFRECNHLASLRDPNISKIIGICSKDDPVSALQEYSEFGDLPRFIRVQVESGNENINPVLNINFLLYLAAQIASAMKYLESRKIVHRDLAARNCMVGKNCTVKVSDHAIYCTQYENDYYLTDKKSRLPVRWMAWESVLMGNHSSKSDVWSFAVTLWEILMLCAQRPFAECTNEQVIENCSYYYQGNDKVRYLEWPNSCPKDIYELMKECWRRNSIERPSFTEIQFFLKRKNLGYNPTLQN